MLVKIRRDTLLQAFNILISFADKRPALAILSNLYIAKSGFKITVIANDMEIQETIHIIDNEMEGDDFAITLPIKKTYDILRTITDNDMLSLQQLDTGKMMFKCGTTKFSMQLISAEHYPLIKAFDNAPYSFVIAQSTLKFIINQVEYAMADKDSRIFLNGVLFECIDDTVTLVATDGHRLSLISAKVSSYEGSPRNVIIPRKTIFEIYKILQNKHDDVVVKVFDNQVHFLIDNKEIITKIIDTKYPDYRKIIPQHNNVCRINRLHLIQSLDRVSIIGLDQLKSVKFNFTQNCLYLHCKNDEQDTSEDELPIEFNTTQPLTIYINAVFMKDILLHCSSEHVTLSMLDSQKSILVNVENDDSFKAIIMPLRG